MIIMWLALYVTVTLLFGFVETLRQKDRDDTGAWGSPPSIGMAVVRHRA